MVCERSYYPCTLLPRSLSPRTIAGGSLHCESMLWRGTCVPSLKASCYKRALPPSMNGIVKEVTISRVGLLSVSSCDNCFLSFLDQYQLLKMRFSTSLTFALVNIFLAQRVAASPVPIPEASKLEARQSCMTPST